MLKNLLASTAILCLLAACGGGRNANYAGGEGGGVLKVGKPYEIEGRTYIPAHTPDYEETGIASWYGPGFHGKATANGEKFDQHAMTAAHRTLPMPSVVEVTNLENGRSAILVVNDRGPFSKNRILDLSKSAADKLGVIDRGTATVRVKYLRDESRELIERRIAAGKLKADEKTLAMLDLHSPRGTIAPPAPEYALISSANAAEPPAFGATETTVSAVAPVAPVFAQDLASPQPAAHQAQTQIISSPASGHFVQAGSFSREQNANELAQKLASLGEASVKPVDISGRTWYRVRLGPLEDGRGAQNALAAVRDMGIADARIVTE